MNESKDCVCSQTGEGGISKKNWLSFILVEVVTHACPICGSKKKKSICCSGQHEVVMSSEGSDESQRESLSFCFTFELNFRSPQKVKNKKNKCKMIKKKKNEVQNEITIVILMIFLSSGPIGNWATLGLSSRHVSNCSWHVVLRQGKTPPSLPSGNVGAATPLVLSFSQLPICSKSLKCNMSASTCYSHLVYWYENKQETSGFLCLN